MFSIDRILKLGVLAVLAATVTGCIVLPYGSRGRHGGYYSSAPAEGQPIMQPAPQAPRHSHGR